MIEISSITKSYYGVPVVESLSLTVPRGSVFGFLGPNGAGKTTTIKMLVGLSYPDSGRIAVAGQSPIEESVREYIGFMPESPFFYDYLTPREYLRFANGLFANRKKGFAGFDDLLRRVDLYEARNKYIRFFSKGMRQRLGFAQSLINNPDYLFLDEPLDGLDPIGRRETKLMIKELQGMGKTVFFNSHILADIEELCDTIGVIHKGKLLYSGSVSEFTDGKPIEEKFIEVIESRNNKRDNAETGNFKAQNTR